ncbi:cytochrome ubiquinol oxidase subunit II [Rhodobacter sp. NTK016B]|uniref:cytochrome ubiquinol oxidase subunit II n=1 Tax=Rhodobacter sp. NTK016B TaxID=2759676 RepID=UPI001A8D7186|nr:cytochrome ubiquinol oxidase subunit II [Rhodobacter sp. NTK016B]MBN8292144.1 cytochrome ubiquinol oxidase subunit II [Rhodobacter sp. NTK016B]
MRFRHVSKVMLLAGCLALAACNGTGDTFLLPAGPIAAAQRLELFKILGWTLIAILPVFVLVPIFLWRYRYRNGKARYTPDWDRSSVLEILMWGVPLVIVTILSVQLYRTTHALDPFKPIESDNPPLRVQVVGLDWKWLFIYPDLGIATVNELAFPAQTSVALDLTTDTVMQSFLISALAGQIYAMPGMRTRLHILADAPGEFEGENTQFNGTGFPDQRFNAIAMTPEAFDTWVAQVRSDGQALTSDSYAVVAEASTGVQAQQRMGGEDQPEGVLHFSSVEDDLFGTILHRYTRGTAVPPSAQPGATGYDPQAATGGQSQ